mmetsp:Transcript_24762/g.43617  ORF Transcript_24762/g.43617 Transcript_24762/m.43617 type:complete len:117 (+) Transcript_24762:1-351(+)
MEVSLSSPADFRALCISRYLVIDAMLGKHWVLFEEGSCSYGSCFGCLTFNMKILALLACILSLAAAEDIPINPAALSGLLIAGLLLIFTFFGFCMLSDVHSPQVFTATPLLVGKEK